MSELLNEPTFTVRILNLTGAQAPASGVAVVPVRILLQVIATVSMYLIILVQFDRTNNYDTNKP